MKKDFDIESLFKNIQLIKLDPAKEEACQERLKSYFAKLEAQERWEEKPERTTSRPWFAYATACVVLLCVVISSIFFYKAQMTIAKEKTKTILQKKYEINNITNIDVNLLTQQSITDLLLKKLVVNLVTQEIVEEIHPNPVELSDSEKKLTKEILNNKKIPFYVFVESKKTNKQDEDIIVNPPPLFPSFTVFKQNDKVGARFESFVTFYSTDTIIKIGGYQYPNTVSKLAHVEVESSETKGYHAIIIVDLGRKKIIGADFK